MTHAFYRFFPLLLLSFLIVGCGGEGGDPAKESNSKPPKPSTNEIRLRFTYGSEKEKWIEALTGKFNAARHETGTGKRIFVEHIPMGSGECVDEVLQNRQQTHLISPASGVFIKLGNADSIAATGGPLVEETTNLVLSPVVIAMWKTMAEALGWPDKAIGWKEIHDLALDERGWASHNFPQWGRFRFGHTHPEYSNSGIISLIAETYAGAGKVRDLTLQDISRPETGQYLEEIEAAIVHYGQSTGFFGRKLFANGPGYLSCAVLYENMVIESYDQNNLPFPVVAIYPSEGTFYSDHPVGIVARDYVTDDHRAAASLYIEFLTASEQQISAMEYGFRPGDVAIPLSERFTAARGVDPRQPQTTLEVPGVTEIKAILDLWHQRKKKSNVALVLDVSGSMKDDGKMESAKLGANQLVEMLGENDQLSILAFNAQGTWLCQNQPVGSQRAELTRQIASVYADGGTALYDAVMLGEKALNDSYDPKKISAMVVLSDGADQDSKGTLAQLVSRLQSVREGESGIRVFTIGYGKGARQDILEQIADATRGKYFKGTPENIETIFKEISTFF